MVLECRPRQGYRLGVWQTLYQSTEFKSPRVSMKPWNVDPQDQGVPNAPEVKPQGGVTNAEFRDAIRMLSQVVANKGGQ
uniref:Gag-pol polyprotein n=1 Tax=Solanum tuberosum TaxID=4113 RepID=M1D8U1_SOLTU